MRKLDTIHYKRALDFSYNFYRDKYRKGIKFPYFKLQKRKPLQKTGGEPHASPSLAEKQLLMRGSQFLYCIAEK